MSFSQISIFLRTKHYFIDFNVNFKRVVFLIFFFSSNQTFLFNYCVVCHELQLASMKKKKSQINIMRFQIHTPILYIYIYIGVIFLCRRKKSVEVKRCPLKITVHYRLLTKNRGCGGPRSLTNGSGDQSKLIEASPKIIICGR